MNAEFAYYTETDGKISFLRGGQKSEDIGYFVRIRLDLVKGSLVIPVPETIEGKSVTLVGIMPELPDDRPVPELPEPLIRRISIPSGVRHIRIGTSITRDSTVSEGTSGEKFNPLNGSVVEISPDNHKFCVFGQGIYSIDMTKLYHIFSPGETFSVPYGVRTIYGSAGCAVKGMKKLIIPESVIDIGESAFEGCTDLEEADIHAKNIGRRAFYGCKSLTKLTAEGLSTMHKNSFEDCSGIGEILKDAFKICCAPNKFKFKIDKSTGDFCLSLDCAQIIQPDHPENERDKHVIFGNSPFLENDHLRKLALSNIEAVCFGAFAECEALNTLIIKNTVCVGQFAFMSCHALDSAYLDCKEIYGSAFSSCTSLEKVRLLNTEIIHSGVFSHCEALKEIKLPKTLRKIGNHAFYKTSIQRLTVPPGVKEIGFGILSAGVLEIVSVNNTLVPPCEDILHAGAPGVTLAVRCAETNEILYELDLSYDLTGIFTGSEIDTEAYNKSRNNFLGYNGALISARNILRRFPNTESGVFEPLKRYVSDLSALNILEIIDERDCDKLWNYRFLDDIEDKRFLDLTDYSAKQGATEITALLMQKLHERNNGKSCEPEFEL